MVENNDRKNVKKYAVNLIVILLFTSKAFAVIPGSKEIDLFFEDLTKSMNAKSATLIANAFSTDGEIISLAGGIYKGQSEIRLFFDEGFKGPHQTAQFENYVQYIRFPDSTHAVVDGVWKVNNAIIPNYPSCGIFLINHSKQNDQWKADMFYSSVPREGHTAEHGRILSWKKICKE